MEIHTFFMNLKLVSFLPTYNFKARNKLDKLNSVEIWWLNFLEAFGCFPMRPLVWHIKLKWRVFILEKRWQEKAIVKFSHFLFLILFQSRLWWDIRGWWKFTECNAFLHFEKDQMLLFLNNLFLNTHLIPAYSPLSLFNWLSLFKLVFTFCCEIYILE